jgi:hypothetical protein
MPTGRNRLVHVVLALYPRRVRDRYGAEIIELLTHSPTPGRDLADVAWCALADRGASLTMSHTRPQLLRLTGLLAAPLASGVALATVAGMAVAVLGVVEGFGYRVGYRTGDVAFGAYPVVMTGVDPGLVGDPAGQSAEALKGLPALLTVCTVFTLTLVVTRATRRHAPPKPASITPAVS